MIPTSPFDSSTQILAKVLDLRAGNQQVIAANIANAETPGYSPATLHFEEELRSAVGKTSTLPLAGTNARHIAPLLGDLNSVRGTITTAPDQTGIGDENGVSVDEEMMKLSENELLYEAAAQLLRKKLGMIKYVISGGQ
jgi:flagellar basal-body rod protein FlgB